MTTAAVSWSFALLTNQRNIATTSPTILLHCTDHVKEAKLPYNCVPEMAVFSEQPQFLAVVQKKKKKGSCFWYTATWPRDAVGWSSMPAYPNVKSGAMEIFEKCIDGEEGVGPSRLGSRTKAYEVLGKKASPRPLGTLRGGKWRGGNLGEWRRPWEAWNKWIWSWERFPKATHTPKALLDDLEGGLTITSGKQGKGHYTRWSRGCFM